MWLVLRFNDGIWHVRPYNGDMHRYEDKIRGITLNIIAIFHRECDALAYTTLLNQ